MLNQLMGATLHSTMTASVNLAVLAELCPRARSLKRAEVNLLSMESQTALQQFWKAKLPCSSLCVQAGDQTDLVVV